MSDAAAGATSTAPTTTATTTPTTPAAPATATPKAADSARDVQAAAIALASSQERSERLAEAGLGEDGKPLSTQGDGQAPTTTEKKPDPAAEKKDGADKDGKDPADKNSPTARIAALAEQNRRTAAQLKTTEARAAKAEADLAAAKSGDLKTLADVKAAFQGDPLEALKLLGVEWGDVVDRVAGHGRQLTPEEQAAAAEKKANAERDARVKALEDERKAEKEAAEKRAAEEGKQAEAKNAASAVEYLTKNVITAEKFPALVGISEMAAREALLQVGEACRISFEKGERASRYPVDVDESLALTEAALSGLNDYYRDLGEKIRPGVSPAAQPSAAPAAQAAAAAPASADAPAVSLIDQARSQQRGPETLTPSVTARMPPATQTRVLSAGDARDRAIEAAALLPPL